MLSLFIGKCFWNFVGNVKDLVNLSGYTDPIAIVLKFCHGLNSATQDRIAESGTDRPQDRDFDSWFKATRRLDLNRCHESDVPVRGHPSVSLLPLSSPTFYLCICIPPPHLCTISKEHTYSWRLLGPMVRRLPRSRLTDSRRLPASPSAHTSTASDGLGTHWDRSTWCYGTLHYHMDIHIWEAWYCIPLYIIVDWPSQGSLERSLWISLG
jgi:hypothetical protein